MTKQEYDNVMDELRFNLPSIVQKRITVAVAAERARCAKIARDKTAENRTTAERAWATRYFDISAMHTQAAIAYEEIAQAIERGEG